MFATTITLLSSVQSRIRALYGCFFIGIIFLLAPAVASAATIDFALEDTRGVRQSEVQVFKKEGQEWGMTVITELGNTSNRTPYYQRVSGLDPGQVVYVSRRFDKGQPQSNENAPEGIGIKYTVPPEPPDQVTLTVPTINNRRLDFSPGLQRERGVLGLLNKTRSGAGIAPLEMSGPLQDTANRVAQLMHNDRPEAEWYDSFFDTGLVDTDNSRGLYGLRPATMITKNFLRPDWKFIIRYFIQTAWLKEGASPWVMDSLMDKQNTAVGVGFYKTALVVFFYDGCDLSGEACGLNGDYGDASLLEGSGGTAKNTDTSSRKNPRIKIRQVRLRGNSVRVRVRIARQARGKAFLRLRVAGKKTVIRGRRSRNKTSFVFKRKVGKKKVGRKFVIRFRGARGWKNVILRR